MTDTSYILGIDTSNYTTSCALLNCDTGEIMQEKKLLPVKKGEAGLRQSDAVFHHTKQLPELLEKLFGSVNVNISAVCASNVPRNADGSYMPCFLVGEGAARSISAAAGCKSYFTSHQTGHVLAALYSADRLSWLYEDKPFIAFHVSGGTTDALLCKPDKDKLLDISPIASSLDLKAGQAVDRTGLMLGLDFPCGKQLEKLAEKADKHYKCRITFKDGCCCLSGVENQCAKMLEQGEKRENIAAYCLDCIAEAVIGMTEYAVKKYGELNIIYAGGVMSDKLLQSAVSAKYAACFASAEYSCDNAAGIALYAALRKGLTKWLRH